MAPAKSRGVAEDRQMIHDVEGDEGTAFGLAGLREAIVAKTAEVGPLGGRDHIMAKPTEFERDARGEMLVEEQPHPNAESARSRRPSSRAARLRLRAIQCSISDG